MPAVKWRQYRHQDDDSLETADPTARAAAQSAGTHKISLPTCTD